MNKIRTHLSAIVVIASTAAVSASPISPSARRVIPYSFQQIICIDYHTVQQSKSALALKAQVLPARLRDFETALGTVGIDTAKELESLTFVSFRDPDRNLMTIGIAYGSFSQRAILKKTGQDPATSMSYRGSSLYYMVKATDAKSKDLDMTFLDENTLLFGDHDALEIALNVFNGDIPSIDFNRKWGEMMRDLENAPVWSLLSRLGTLEMLRFALGDASKQEDYLEARKRVIGAQYAMHFEDGIAVKVDLTVLTVDPETGHDLISLAHLGTLLGKMKANGAAKVAVQTVSTDFDALGLEMHFKADPTQFQKLLDAKFFDSLCYKAEEGKDGCNVSFAVPMPAAVSTSTNGK